MKKRDKASTGYEAINKREERLIGKRMGYFELGRHQLVLDLFTSVESCGS